MSILKKAVHAVLNRFGYDIVRSVQAHKNHWQNSATGTGIYPRIALRHGRATAFLEPVIFSITKGPGAVAFEQEIFFSQLTLYKLLSDREYEYDSVLDIGSHAGNVAAIFRHLGKKIVTCEANVAYAADYRTDYIDTDFGQRFDLIWCSQVLEHQRNVGAFFNKLFDDLNDNGILALTIPLQADLNLTFGHCNMFSPLMLIYHLVLAGFDCRDIRLKLYGYNIGIILRKKYNGIDRSLAVGSVPPYDRARDAHPFLGDGIFAGMKDSFPAPLAMGQTVAWPNIASINWD